MRLPASLFERLSHFIRDCQGLFDARADGGPTQVIAREPNSRVLPQKFGDGGQTVTLEKTGSAEMERISETSPWTRLVSASAGRLATEGSVAPPTKLVRRAWPWEARPGKREEFQTAPRTRRPEERGTRKPNPSRE